MLHSGNKYGLTYRCTNRKSGDILFVEVWRYGKNGGIIISGNSGKNFYVTQSNQLETGNNGWDKLSITYMLNKNMRNREIEVYLYNNSVDTSFFDDLNIR